MALLADAHNSLIEGVIRGAALHFYYNFVRYLRTLRCTPAMEAGAVSSPLTVQDLIEVTA